MKENVVLDSEREFAGSPETGTMRHLELTNQPIRNNAITAGTGAHGAHTIGLGWETNNAEISVKQSSRERCYGKIVLQIA